MNNKFNNWPIIVVTSIVGILFTVWAKEVELFSWLVRALGVSLVLPGIYVFIQAFNKPADEVSAVPSEIDFTMQEAPQKKGSSRVLSVSLIVAAVCTVLLGLWMLIAPNFFVFLFAILIACCLVLYGFYQLIGLIYLVRMVTVPWYFFVVPSLFIIAGVVILTTPVSSMNYIVSLTTGILLILSSINAAVQRVMIKI